MNWQRISNGGMPMIGRQSTCCEQAQCDGNSPAVLLHIDRRGRESAYAARVANAESRGSGMRTINMRQAKRGKFGVHHLNRGKPKGRRSPVEMPCDVLRNTALPPIGRISYSFLTCDDYRLGNQLPLIHDVVTGRICRRAIEVEMHVIAHGYRIAFFIRASQVIIRETPPCERDHVNINTAHHLQHLHIQLPAHVRRAKL